MEICRDLFIGTTYSGKVGNNNTSWEKFLTFAALEIGFVNWAEWLAESYGVLFCLVLLYQCGVHHLKVDFVAIVAARATGGVVISVRMLVAVQKRVPFTTKSTLIIKKKDLITAVVLSWMPRILYYYFSDTLGQPCFVGEASGLQVVGPSSLLDE